MLYFNFNGYEGFKELFGMIEHGNGQKSRKNHILLQYYKSKAVFKHCVNREQLNYLLNIKSMSDLKERILLRVRCHYDIPKGAMYLNGRAWRSDLYKTDDFRGKTVDGDAGAIRYCRLDNGKVYKMKAGKMYRHLITVSEFGSLLPEAVINWLCEELALEWRGVNVTDSYELHVNRDFESIYDSECLDGDFHSCMTDEDYYDFYINSVKASAAYLTNNEGLIVARAVIFDEVTDEDSGEKLRLCERQYATDDDVLLKQILVNKLIEGGHIDGYKKVGADCRSPKAFLKVSGEPFEKANFRIKCFVGVDENVSYQDSFKWYDYDNRVAYNYRESSYNVELDVTDGRMDGLNWDEYHEEYTVHNVILVYYGGECIYCSEDALDDFILVDDDYCHKSDVVYCDRCDAPFLFDNAVYSELTKDRYCCDDCLIEAENEFVEENPDLVFWNEDEGHYSLKSDYFYSGVLDKYFWSERDKREAEREYLWRASLPVVINKELVTA